MYVIVCACVCGVLRMDVLLGWMRVDVWRQGVRVSVSRSIPRALFVCACMCAFAHVTYPHTFTHIQGIFGRRSTPATFSTWGPTPV